MKTIKNNTSNELTALQNFADKFGLIVKLWFDEDKRKKSMYVLTDNDKFISPKLNYDKMNHFLLGVNSAVKNNLKKL